MKMSKSVKPVDHRCGNEHYRAIPSLTPAVREGLEEEEEEEEARLRMTLRPQPNISTSQGRRKA